MSKKIFEKVNSAKIFFCGAPVAAAFYLSCGYDVDMLGIDKSKAIAFLLGLLVSGFYFIFLTSSRDKDLVPFVSRQLSGDDTTTSGHVKFEHPRIPIRESLRRSETFHRFLNCRRSVRFFDPAPYPLKVLINCIAAAGTAPSGAYCQPWFFVVVRSPEKKMEIRKAVEEEERKNYASRMGQTWVDEVTHLVNDLHEGTDPIKPYLTEAPFLVILMKQKFGIDQYKQRIIHRYPLESVGIAAGMFIAAVHNANLATLTSTPMGAEAKIRKICGRPDHEKVFLLLPVGYPSKTCTVPYRKEIQPPGTSDEHCLRKNIRDIMRVV